MQGTIVTYALRVLIMLTEPKVDARTTFINMRIQLKPRANADICTKT